MPSHTVEQIKSRLAISSIIGKKIPLKLTRVGEFVGLCPFHNEKTPSFTVSDVKGFYHCFGCGAHGDIFGFLMQSEGYHYKDALKLLADLSGVTLKTYTKEEITANSVFYSILEKITSLYQTNLLSSPRGQSALTYIKNRNIGEDVIHKYRLGLAFTDQQLLFQNLKKEFSEQDIKNTHICFVKANGQLLDPMRGRLTFPLLDRAGRPIGFGGRSLNEIQPKYLNSSENPFFKKSQFLYNFNFAQNVIRKENSAILVEGYMDVLSMVNVGIENVIAPLGTALQVTQIQNIWEIADNVLICMDNDTAGQAAAAKLSFDILPYIKAGKSVKFINMLGGKDPDEVIKNRGSSFLKKLIKESQNLSSKLFQSYSNKIGSDSPESRALLRKELAELAAKIADNNLRWEYNQYFRDQLFNKTSNHYIARNKAQDISHQNHFSNSSNLNSNERPLLIIFCILLHNQHLLDNKNIYEEIIRLEIAEEELDELRNAIVKREDESQYLPNTTHQSNLHHKLIPKVSRDTAIKINKIKEAVNLAAGTSSLEAVLMRALKLHSLYIIQQQIEKATLDTSKNCSESSLSRLNALKNCEFELKKALNII